MTANASAKNYDYSPSSLMEYLSCPRRYYYKRVMNLVPVDSDLENFNLEFGTAVHATFNVYFMGRLKGKVLPKEQLVAMFETTLMSELNKNNKLNYIIPARLQKMKDDGVILIMKYIDKIGQHIEPLATELECGYTLPNGKVVTNHIDLVRRGTGTYLAEGKIGVVVEDFKTSSAPYKDEDMMANLQLRSYAYALQKNYPDYKVEAIQYSVLIKNGTLQVLYMELANNWEAEFEMDVISISNGIDNEVFPKNPIPKGFKCAHCPYFKMCWGSERGSKIVKEVKIK